MKLWNGAASAFSESGKGTYDWVKKPFLLLCLFYTGSLLALLRANYYYVDDLGRALMGFHGWLDWSRYVTQGLSFVIHPTPHLTDISPLPQLLAVVLISLAGLLVIYTFTGKKEISWPLLAGVLPMGLSPWFLECFSYKFDAPYMALSVFVSVLPFLWWERDRKKFLVSSFVGLLVMTMTYQASSGVYVIETIFLAYHSWQRGGRAKDIFLWCLSAAVVYVLALLIFQLFLLGPSVDGYVSTQVAAPSEIPKAFYLNAAAYVSLAWADLNWIEQTCVMAIIGFFLLRGIRETKRNPFASFLAMVALISSTLVLSYGAYLVLEKPLFLPRGMLGVGFWFSFLLILFLSMAEKKRPVRWMIFLLVWQLIVGAAAYGDALVNQKRYTDFRIRLLVQDLNALHLTEEEGIPYHILGDIGLAPTVRGTGVEYPIVKRLIRSTFSETDVFYFYTCHDLGSHVVHEGDLQPYKNLPLALENRYHRIRTDGKDVLIELKEGYYERK